MDRITLDKPLGAWYFIKTEEYLPGKKDEGTRKLVWDMGFGYQRKRLRSNGFLIAPDGRYWAARSGGHKKGTIPDGFYQIGSPRAPWNSNKNPFKDDKGFAWFCPTTSGYMTELLGRDAFGIHPDGGTAGTAGCIGLTDKDTRSAHDALRDTSVKVLIVRPKDMTDRDLRENVEFMLENVPELLPQFTTA